MKRSMFTFYLSIHHACTPLLCYLSGLERSDDRSNEGHVKIEIFHRGGSRMEQNDRCSIFKNIRRHRTHRFLPMNDFLISIRVAIAIQVYVIGGFAARFGSVLVFYSFPSHLLPFIFTLLLL